MKTFLVVAALCGLSLGDKLPAYGSPPLGAYGVGNDLASAGSVLGGVIASVDEGGAIPGVAGEDYPIFATVPETAFSCAGKVEGGYYADPQASCQAFHVCVANGEGGLTKLAFLCPNGTIFNQAYFICDWWFNFDCAAAEGLYSKNEELAAAREAATAAAAAAQAAAGLDAAASASVPVGYGAPTYFDASASASVSEGYGAPAPAPAPVAAEYGAPPPAPVAAEYGAPPPAPLSTGYGAPASSPVAAASATSYGAPAPAPLSPGYGAPLATNAATGYGAPLGTGYGAPPASYSF